MRHRVGDNPRSRAEFRGKLSANTRWMHLGAKLSGACARFGEYELGIIAASATLERREDAIARANRGFCYFSLGRYPEAADDFAMAGALGAAESGATACATDVIWEVGRAEVSQPCLPAPVSIVIPVFNQVELTRQCLEAVAENTPEDLYEVVMVDDGSTDGTKDFLNLLSGDVKVVTNEQRIGYWQSCKLGAEAVSSGKYLVLLSNDTRPQQGWLESALTLAESDPSIGVIGTRLVSDDGTVQEVGGSIFSDGSLARINGETLETDPRRESIREVDFCSSTGLLIRSEVWKQTAGFDQRYESDAYRVADLCMAVRKARFRVLYQPAAVLVR